MNIKKFRIVTACVLLAALLLGGCSVKAKEENSDSQRLTKILDNISGSFHPGTSGSSLNAVRFAAELIGWASTTEMDKKEAGQIVLNWLKEQSPEIRDAFAEKLSGIADSYGRILKDGAADLLESAGVEKDLSNLGTRLKELVDAVLASGGVE